VTTRFIKTETDRDMLEKFIASHDLPFSASIAKGNRRSTEQNALQRKWMAEIAEQREDEPAEYYRGYCKLRFGVPIMRRDDAEFCEKYDRILKPLPYETKIELMMEPIDFPVTRQMNVKQKTEYLDEIHRHWSGQGIVLTQPEQAA